MGDFLGHLKPNEPKGKLLKIILKNLTISSSVDHAIYGHSSLIYVFFKTAIFTQEMIKKLPFRTVCGTQDIFILIVIVGL